MLVKKVVFLTYNKEKTASEHLRIFGPLSYTKIQVVNAMEEGKPNLDLIQSGDLIVFQRNFLSRFSNYKAVIDQAHKFSIPVVMDLDDSLVGHPKDNSEQKWSRFAFELPALMYAIVSVDAITVTTPTLKSLIEQYNKNVYKLPNFLDDSIWKFAVKPTQEKQLPVQIAFMSTLAFQSDLDKLTEPLRILADKYKESISFLIYSPEIPDPLKDLRIVQRRELLTNDYANFETDLKTISGDIAVVPLSDNLLDQCISPFRYLEYTAIGLPCVCSNKTPYKEVIRDGFNGFLADTSDDWVEKLSELIDDHILRNEILSNARTDVRTNWMLHDHAHLWQQCYDQILAQGVISEPDENTLFLPIGQLAEQFEEQIQKYFQQNRISNQTNQELRSIIEEKTNEIQVLQQEKHKLKYEMEAFQQYATSTFNESKKKIINKLEMEEQIKSLTFELENSRREIADYLLSDSWRLTRPLRKIIKMLRGSK